MKETLIQIDGHPTRLLTSGPEGAPVLLFLHGFPEHALAWRDVMQALPEYRCVAFDQRGFGISHNPAPDLRGFAMKHLLADLVTVIDHIGADKVTLVGHDWGAAVAYAAAFTLPDRIERLIVMNGVHPTCFQQALSAGGPQSAASAYIDWLRKPGVEDILRADGFARLIGLFAANMDMSWLAQDVRDDYLREWSRPRAIEGMVSWYRVSPVEVAAAGVPRPLPNWAQTELRVTMPHLLIWGANDTALLPEATQGLDALCDNLTRVTLENCDHWLHHQQPETVSQAVREWLRNS